MVQTFKLIIRLWQVCFPLNFICLGKVIVSGYYFDLYDKKDLQMGQSIQE